MENDYKTDYKTDFTDYETDYAVEAPLPTPGETPYRTPHLSRRPSRNPSQQSSSPERRPSPSRRFGESLAPGNGEDEQYHEFDPRRFTPTLHANLVAEILSLRRDLESKDSLIESLEDDIYNLKEEQETTRTAEASANKEARDAKRLLARAANDDGVASVAAERDDAIHALNEIKKQMERLTVSKRKAQEDLERLKTIQERDAEKFEDAKRGFERRAHVAEGRLKAVLDELAAEQEAEEAARQAAAEDAREQEPGSPKSITMSPDRRPMSMESLMSRRPMSLGMGDDECAKLGMSLAQGLSLAEELSFNNDSGSESGSGTEYETGAESQFHSGSESDSEDERLDEELDELDNDNSVPGDMVSDHDSVDEYDDLPEPVDMGVQVGESAFDKGEDRILILEAQLGDKDEEVKRLYGFLDQKNADIDALYVEIDSANSRVIELEDKIGLIESTAFTKEKEFDKKRLQLAAEVTACEARREEVEQRWILIDQKAKAMAEVEKEYATREKNHGIRDKFLKEWEAAIDEQDASLGVREKELDKREHELTEKESVIRAEQELLVASTVCVPLDDSESVAVTAGPLAAASPKMVETHVQTENEPNAQHKRQSTIEVEVLPKPEYVTSEAQTDMPMPPPACATSELRTVETLPVAAVVRTVSTAANGTQTNPVKVVPPPIIHVPGIMVTPPPPTPPLPPPPAPTVKDAGVQTNVPRTRSHSMQTEGIKLDERLKNLAPHLRPSLLTSISTSTATSTETSTATSTSSDATVQPTPNVPRRSSKRLKRNSGQNGSTSASATLAPRSAMKQTSGNGSPKSPQAEARERKRDALPRSLFELSTALTNSSGDEDFPDERELDLSGNEYTTALTTAPRPRKFKTHNLGSEFQGEGNNGGLARRQNSMRKNALVSSGVNAHATSSRNLARSPSIQSGRTDKTSSTGKPGPPFPVPTRHSSRRPGYASDRERTESPTPRMRGAGRGRHLQREHSVRKAKSPAPIPDYGDAIIKLPSAPSTSTAPGSPDSEFPPPLPADQITTPYLERSRYGTQSRHRQQASKDTQSTAEQTSVGSVVQQTSVVDAIAQTMVGEWMWKYVRRRKSFVVSAEASPNGDDSAGGTRHRRWVWLAPYERAVMWSSRQPTSGPALLGKSGRKLLIQSVLDVKDDTPLPKGTAAQPGFNRSILILTPQRALKFTAPNRERHYVWLTALSFLSHSPEGSDGHLALPPPMPFEYDQLQQQVQPVHRAPTRAEPAQFLPPPPPIPAHKTAFSPVRDSVRLAKGKSRQTRLRQASIVSEESFSAEPPSIPRFPGHSRKRSQSATRPNTRGGYEKPLPINVPSLNGSSVNDSLYGVGGVGISPDAEPSPSDPNWSPAPNSAPLGTVRMAAFVDQPPRIPKRYEEPRYQPRPRDDDDFRRRRLEREKKGKSKQESFFGIPSSAIPQTAFPENSPAALYERERLNEQRDSIDELEDYDPFRGFAGRRDWT